ncbi:MAG: DMT family protein [Candidatus Sericytochromatia bacterium]
MALKSISLLVIANIFMTIAWYWHLKFKHEAMLKVIIISWFIAFIEYCFQVPANRIGNEQFNAVQLKTIQEIISLSVFSIFSIYYLQEKFTWNYILAFIMIIGATFLVFKK